MMMMMMMMMMMIDDDADDMMMNCDVAEWLLEAYRTQWLAMLQVDNGTDIG